MKKKSFVIVLALLACGVSGEAQQAFKSLSLGLEVGTTGAGVELAIPIVTDHIVLVGGFNAPSISHGFTMNIDPDIINDRIDEVNASLSELQQYGINEHVDTRFSEIPLTISPVLNLGSVKAMVELYPSKKSSFHFTVGAYFGLGSVNFVSATVSTGNTFWSEFGSLQDEVNALNEKYSDYPGFTPVSINDSDLQFNVGKKTYAVHEQSGEGVVDAALEIAKVRPYVGLGFGRSVPNRHFGFQFELGAWYHGKPALTSDSEVTYNSSAYYSLIDDISFLDKVVFYPSLTFRFIYKIF